MFNKSPFFKTSFCYCGCVCFILIWWTFAFYPTVKDSTPNVDERQRSFEIFPSPVDCLSAMKRDAIHEALLGDTSLMCKLIADWDVDAQILKEYGRPNTKRLPEELFIRAQTLGRHLKKHPKEPLLGTSIYDAFGGLHRPRQEGIIPQTYVAATFLLALSQPEDLKTLPKGMRLQTTLFPEEMTAKIPNDLDRYHHETLFLKQPKRAFVSPFSHPAMVHGLEREGIELFWHKIPETIEEIPQILRTIGEASGTSLKAELLNIFCLSAFISIENRMSAFETIRGKRVMAINCYHNLSVPSKKSLTLQLLKRLRLEHFEPADSNLWSLPITKEEILAFKPDTLLISTPSGKIQKGIEPLNTVKNVRFLDASIQESPTQFIVLAYWDLATSCLSE